MKTFYTILTDEPLDAWCHPKIEGQVIETVEKTKTFTPSYGTRFTIPIRRRWVAAITTYGNEQRLTWVEVPCISQTVEDLDE